MEEQVIDIADGQVLTKTTYENGKIEYRNRKGELHRIVGPAVIYSDGTQAYYVNGKRHRIGGPAYIGSDGTQYYYVDGKLHRYDGPDGTQAYWENDKLHRTDGPAVIYPDGTHRYYVDGIEYAKEEYPQVVIAYKHYAIMYEKFGVRFKFYSSIDWFKK